VTPKHHRHEQMRSGPSVASSSKETKILEKEKNKTKQNKITKQEIANFVKNLTKY